MMDFCILNSTDETQQKMQIRNIRMIKKFLQTYRKEKLYELEWTSSEEETPEWQNLGTSVRKNPNYDEAFHESLHIPGLSTSNR